MTLSKIPPFRMTEMAAINTVKMMTQAIAFLFTVATDFLDVLYVIFFFFPTVFAFNFKVFPTKTVALLPVDV